MPMMSAAPRSCARFVAPSHDALLPIWPGASTVWMITALPATSRPAKSAPVPSPTHTASASRVPGSDADPIPGLADANSSCLPAPAAVRLQSNGNHCGPSSNSTRWMSVIPSRRKCRSVQSAAITSYFVPEMRPQYRLPSSRLRRENATISSSHRFNRLPSMFA